MTISIQQAKDHLEYLANEVGPFNARLLRNTIYFIGRRELTETDKKTFDEFEQYCKVHGVGLNVAWYRRMDNE